MELQFREITLADKPLFDKMFEVSFHKTPECSFAYVYLWRENFDPKVYKYVITKAGLEKEEDNE